MITGYDETMLWPRSHLVCCTNTICTSYCTSRVSRYWGGAEGDSCVIDAVFYAEQKAFAKRFTRGIFLVPEDMISQVAPGVIQ